MSQEDLNTEDIITKFELQAADLTELSSSEELDLLNDKYMDVCDDRNWIFLRKPATGALAYDSTAALWYAPKPEDFAQFVENNTYTDNTMDVQNNASPKVVFVGVNRQPYQIINFNDRIQYRNNGGFCYLDPNTDRIYFTQPPPDTSFYLFDYKRIPPLLKSSETILGPELLTNIDFEGTSDPWVLQVI